MVAKITRTLFDLTLVAVGVALLGWAVLAGARHLDAPAAVAAPAPAAVDPTAAAPSPADPRLDADIAVAARMVTTADKGGSLGRTLRWAGPTVTYHVAPAGDWTPAFLADVDAALAWAADAAGLTFVPVADDADAQLTITGRARPGGSVWVAPAGGYIGAAHVELGCCSSRVAYEEIGQSLGVLADLGDDRSVFSSNRTRLLASDWDRWVVRSLYSIPSGSSPDAAAAALRANAGA